MTDSVQAVRRRTHRRKIFRTSVPADQQRQGWARQQVVVLQHQMELNPLGWLLPHACLVPIRRQNGLVFLKGTHALHGRVSLQAVSSTPLTKSSACIISYTSEDFQNGSLQSQEYDLGFCGNFSSCCRDPRQVTCHVQNGLHSGGDAGRQHIGEPLCSKKGPLHFRPHP